jgi:predicted nucleic acid-binding protein
MKTVFADTWFFRAILSERDQHHDKVVHYLGETEDFIITTRWVLAETANAAAGSAYREDAARFLVQVESDPDMTIIKESDVLYQRGMKLYISRSDKAWSLTDCISFVVMDERGITEALTADHHFEQAGFRPLFARN